MQLSVFLLKSPDGAREAANYTGLSDPVLLVLWFSVQWQKELAFHVCLDQGNPTEQPYVHPNMFSYNWSVPFT